MSILNLSFHPRIDGATEKSGVNENKHTVAVEASPQARADMPDALNRTLRRLRHYQTEADWIAATLDGALLFGDEAAIFAVEGEQLVERAHQGFDLASGSSFPINSAAAFANAIHSKDPVVALRTAAEVSSLLSSKTVAARAHLFPIMNGSRVVAILFAASSGRVDGNALELVAGMASLVLERQTNAALKVQIAPGPHVQAASTQKGVSPASRKSSRNTTLPPWSALPRDVRASHIRAQRFSRVRVAEMQLSRPEACRAGREQNNVYLFLKREIDAAREVYRSQFMTTSSIVDYLHLELVRTAAEGDESKLGEDYPGELV